MTEASFTIKVTTKDALEFAKISGDWNPLHTDPEYASKTIYKAPVLHGAFSAGLISRLAGMYLPGKDCLLHSVNLRFKTPIIPPAQLVVKGVVRRSDDSSSRVEVVISDQDKGTRYVEGSYEFGHHQTLNLPSESLSNSNLSGPTMLITGATGGIGKAVLNLLGDNAVGLSRSDGDGLVVVPDIETINSNLPNFPLRGIVHCAWETPDNVRFSDLDLPKQSIEAHVASPLRQVQSLARLLLDRGVYGATLVLLGSTFAESGRHHFRTPLYSLAKSMIPTLTHILAIELAAKNMKCIGVVLDIIDGGMNEGMSEASKLSNADRMLSGKLATPADVAGQIKWVLENESTLASGAMINLTGGSIP